MAGRKSQSPALLTSTRTYTYSELSDSAVSISAFLLRSGARKGDRALLLSENGFFWVASYLAILRSGLVCVPLPVRSTTGEVDYIVHTAEPRFAFVEARATAKFGSALKDIEIISDRSIADSAISLDELQSQQSDTPDSADIAPNDLAALMFTSGSTGKPRGVMVSAGNILANTQSIIDYLALTSADRILAVLPFHYCFGASLLHTHLRCGGSIVVENRFLYPDAVLQRMLSTNCTGFAGVPSHFQILLRRSNLANTHFSHLRYVQQAGGHLAPSFLNELRAALPNTQIFVMYGQTEATARLAYLPPDMLDHKLGSIGRAIPGVTLQVIDESGRPVLPGQTGQIVAEGDNVTLGYWHDPKETTKCFRDGKLYTGDLATIDEDRFIYIVDRAKDFLKCGGQRVSCQHIEDVLLQFGALVEAAVIGIPDEVLGEAVKAFVVPRDSKVDSIPEHLSSFCRTALPPPQVPKEIVVVDHLPKNSSGKVLKHLLREGSIVTG